MLQFSSKPTHFQQHGNGIKYNTCAICIQDYELNDVYNVTKCFHTFHKSCISEWSRRNNLCSLCKKILVL
jgi:hypothetical protein